MVTNTRRKIKAEPVNDNTYMARHPRTQRSPDPGQSTSQPVDGLEAPGIDGDVVMVNGGSCPHTKVQPTVIDEGYNTGPAENYESPVTGDDSQASAVTNSSAVSFGDDSNIRKLGKDANELVQAINGLEQLGVEERTKPLPKIVVVGDQSAGKSSLIEAISEIKVPRSTGTCTRCPLQINLSGSSVDSEWSCSVTLHKKYEYYGFQHSELENGIGLGPWKAKHTPSDIVFARVKNITDLEVILRKAQLAILNPQDDPRKYVTGNGELNTATQVQFSPNIVRLDIRGPGLPNLSFYDLPGIINQTEDASDAAYVKIVKNLVKEYIKDDNCLVLLACSMEGDIANSSAAKVVRNMRAEDRCIGVLTKPDRLPAGDSVEIWKSILEGSKFALTHKYFVTKQPAQKDLDRQISHAEAREQELKFFSSNEPWKSSFSKYNERFGTTQLQKRLSSLLAEQIRRCLPEIETEVKAKINDVDQQLMNMPEAPQEDALRIVHQFINNFRERMENSIKGEHPYTEFRQNWRVLIQEFRAALASMRPVCITLSDVEAGRRKLFSDTVRQREPINVDDSENEEMATPSPSVGRKRPAPNVPETPSKRQKATSTTPSTTGRSKLAKRFTLDNIRNRIQMCSSSDIPDLVHPKAIELLISESIEHWETALSEFFHKFAAFLRDEVSSAYGRLVEPWASTDLDRQTVDAVEQSLKSFLEDLQRDASRSLRFEQAKPLTYNDEFSGFSESRELASCLDSRRKARSESHINEEELKTGKFTEGAERKKKLDKVTEQELGPDLYAREIEVVAKVKGYYIVASARLVDNICQAIQCDTFERCRTEMHNNLADALGVYKEHSLENCKRLLASDPQREAERQRLVKEKANLKQALELLAKLH